MKSKQAIKVKLGASFWAMLHLEGASTKSPDEPRPSAVPCLPFAGVVAALP